MTRSLARNPPLPQATRLAGQNWTAAEGCPLYTDLDFSRSLRQMEGILGNPNLDAFVLTGGFSQFIPTDYRRVAGLYTARIANGSLALVIGDTLPIQIDEMKANLSSAQVGQRPFEMGAVGPSSALRPV